MLGVFFHEIGERALIDLTDLRRDVIERRMLPELLARGSPLVLFGQRLLGVITLEGDRRSGVAP